MPVKKINDPSLLLIWACYGSIVASMLILICLGTNRNFAPPANAPSQSFVDQFMIPVGVLVLCVALFLRKFLLKFEDPGIRFVAHVVFLGLSNIVVIIGFIATRWTGATSYAVLLGAAAILSVTFNWPKRPK